MQINSSSPHRFTPEVIKRERKKSSNMLVTTIVDKRLSKNDLLVLVLACSSFFTPEYVDAVRSSWNLILKHEQPSLVYFPIR